MMLGSNDVAGLRRVLGAAHRRGASPAKICALLERAIDGVYKPQGGFSKRDLDIAFLVKAIGGPRLLYALGKSHGLASWRTVNRHLKIPKLLPSVGVPSADEISHNISSFYSPDVRPPLEHPPSGILPGVSLMFDGVALETRCRHCPERDQILGLCREHSHRVNLKVDNVESVEIVRNRLDSQDLKTKVCFGSDATVVATVPVSDDKNYSPSVLVVSPSDKTENAENLAKWMQTVIDVWTTHEFGAKSNGKLWSIASDGDPTYRAAKFKICMNKLVEKDSYLGKLLGSLSGLNRYTSKEGITMTCDPKHIFKRFATLLRSTAGFMINKDEIQPSDIAHHLAQLQGLDLKSAWQLLDPMDKQNVPKAVTLLQCLVKLKDLSEPVIPSENQKRKAIIFAAEFMGYFMRPFIDVDMNLTEQIENLATYTFLAAAIHIKHGTNCLTHALYADTQATVKNIIFTVARMKEVDPEKALYILLEGTDRLEELFGDCRTQDNARNFDIEQLGQKLGVATLIHSAMQRNPDLDRGHRRLAVKDNTGIDHLNPKSWRGKVKVGNVNLEEVWKKGQRAAEKIFEDYYGTKIDFEKCFAESDCDLLRPSGEYVGVSYDPKDARSEQENPEPCSIYTHYGKENTDNERLDPEGDADTYDEELGMGLEDLLPDLPEDIDQDREPEAFSKTIYHAGKEILKSSLVATLNNKNSKKVPWRTWRVRGVAINELYNSKHEEMEADDMEDEEYMKKGDLAATLVWCGTEICLCVVEVKEFQYVGEKAVHVSMTLDDLEDSTKKVKVIGQIISLKPSTPRMDYWEWTRDYLSIDAPNERLTRQQFVVEIPSFLVHPLGPHIIQKTTGGPEEQISYITWRLSQVDLQRVFNSLWDSLEPDTERVVANAQLLLSSKNLEALPYRGVSNTKHFFGSRRNWELLSLKILRTQSQWGKIPVDSVA
jgi:hypothetical protein